VVEAGCANAAEAAENSAMTFRTGCFMVWVGYEQTDGSNGFPVPGLGGGPAREGVNRARKE
ncbi:MAG: hypothetical protein ACK5CF_08300, partial [Opitutaceae bacterium]